jgi:TolB-like protein
MTTLVRCFRIVSALVLILAFAGCRTTQTRYLHKNADLGSIGKVAVLPFENLTQERTAADKVQKIFYLELLSLDVFEVAEPGQVTKTMRGSGGGGVDALGTADYQKIGKDLGVEGVFVGTVVDYAEGRTGSAPTPDVTIQLRLIETHSGATIWSAGQTRSGASASTRLFGIGGESLTEAARRVVRSELQTLLK